MDFKTTETTRFDNVDQVFFYTDYVSHSFYGKMMKLVREWGIPFSYLHGLNLKEVTRFVYMEVNN